MDIEKGSRLRNFHQAKWDEEIIFELSTKGERGILVPDVDVDIKKLSATGFPVYPPTWFVKYRPPCRKSDKCACLSTSCVYHSKTWVRI